MLAFAYGPASRLVDCDSCFQRSLLAVPFSSAAPGQSPKASEQGRRQGLWGVRFRARALGDDEFLVWLLSVALHA